MTANDDRRFAAPTWIKAMVMVLSVGMPIATTLVLKFEGVSLVTGAFAAMSVIGVAALIEVALQHVVLGDEELRIRSLTKRRNIARSAIDRVTWETGSGVSVQLEDGRWVKLPEVGGNSEALANSIRAWLKRSES